MSDFLKACDQGRVTDARRLYLHDRSVLNCRDDDGHTPLMLSLYNQHSEVYRWLVTLPGSCEGSTSYNGTALHMACSNGADMETVATIARQMDGRVNQKDKWGETALELAVWSNNGPAVTALARVPAVLWDSGHLQDVARGSRYLTGQKQVDMLSLLDKMDEERKRPAKVDKVAVFVINTNYGQSRYSNLEGPLEDLRVGQKLFESKGYEVIIIENSANIRDEVLDKIEEKNLKDSARVFQFFFSGHGVLKTTAEQGRFAVGEATVTTYKQTGQLGDCLVNTDGSLCQELELSSYIAEELNLDAKMSFFYDMCREEFKEAPKEHKTVINIFDYKQKIQKIGADRRMIRIFSSQLGEYSRGISFFQSICQHIADSTPEIRGIQIGEMMKFEKEKQKCDIDVGCPGWDNTFWPLE